MEHQNIWAPWRMEYLQQLGEPGDEGCFLCQDWAEPKQDAEHSVVWRTARSLVVLNRYPYTNGHLLAAPGVHVAGLADLSDDHLGELMVLVQDAQAVLTATLEPQGFNIGINLGRCAGAGVPGHLHVHIVPRWEGDTNFMATVAHTRVVPQSLEAMYELLAAASARLGLPRAAGTGQ